MPKNKLVRDKIPAIIEAKGGKAVTRILDNQEYQQELITKLLKEAQEFATDKNIEEMADLVEVIKTLQESFGFTAQQVEQVRLKQLEERGGFKQKIYLQEVIEN